MLFRSYEVILDGANLKGEEIAYDLYCGTGSISLFLAQKAKFVYGGNVFDETGQTTYCPSCRTPLIQRDWHAIRANRMKENKCGNCESEISGVFTGEVNLTEGRRTILGIA